MDISGLICDIGVAIEDIDAGRTTPQRSGIGRMLATLGAYDQSAYADAMSRYKPVAQRFFGQKDSHPKKQTMDERIDRVVDFLDICPDDFDGDNLSQDAWDRLMSEAHGMLGGKRQRRQEGKPAQPVETEERDRQSYTFEGNSYGKGKLVLAVVQSFCRQRGTVDQAALKRAFPDHLLRNYGIFKPLADAQRASEKRKRFFLDTEQIVHLSDGPVAVCNQFTRDNIQEFLQRAAQLGFKID